MNINLTLFGEMITFAILVWVTMKYIWPPIVKAMQDRQKQIADGLAAADRGQKNFELARQAIKKQMQTAKLEATNIIDQANKRVALMLEDAKTSASIEGAKLIAMAQNEIKAEMNNAKQQLRTQFVDLVVLASSKVLQSTIDETANRKLVNEFINQLYESKR